MLAVSVQHFWIVSRPAEVARPVDIKTLKLSRVPSETDLAYVARVNAEIYRATYNCDPDNFVLSIIERALAGVHADDLFDQGILVKERFTCGYCHQRAFLLVSELRSAGLTAEVFGLNGHVVARVLMGDDYYLTDPDYGVGPMLYAEDEAILKKASLEAYKAFGNADLVSDMISTRANNEPYYNRVYDLSLEQSKFFWRSNFASSCLAACGAIAGLSSIMLMRGRQKSDT